MKTLFAFIVAAGLAFTSFADSTNQLEMRSYQVSPETFVAHLKHLLPSKPEWNSTELLIFYFHQNGVEIKPPESVFLNEQKGLVLARATKSDQDKIEKLVEKIATDTNDIQVATRTYKIMPEDSLATVEVFTRSGQTNLVRNTHTKDGIVLFRSQDFYGNGTEVGIYVYQVANGTNSSFGSAPGAPYYFNIAFDSSNRPRSAHILATNFVMLDWFLCTNGVFYPADSSLIREANGRLPKDFPPH